MTRRETFAVCCIIALVGALLVFGLIAERIRRGIDRLMNGRDV